MPRALDPAEVREPLPEYLKPCLTLLIGLDIAHEHANALHPRGLLLLG